MEAASVCQISALSQKGERHFHALLLGPGAAGLVFLFMVLLTLLVPQLSLLAAALELVVGPLGAAAADGSFAEDEATPASDECAPASASRVQPLLLPFALPVIVLRGVNIRHSQSDDFSL